MINRNQSLDALRGVAIILVLLCHYSQALGLGSYLLDVGGCGVDLFFVLSGFLISGLLFSEFEKTGHINVKRFLIRRAFKIYPPFYSLLALTAAFLLVFARTVPKTLLADSIFLQNYLPHFWEHGWSLAVEEHFYLFLPAMLLLLIRLDRRKHANPFRLIPFISIGLSALCLYLRIMASRHGAELIHIELPTHLRADALFAGVTLGYFSKFDPESFKEAGKRWVIAAGVLFAIAVVLLPPVPRLTFAYVASSFIVAWAVNQPPKNWLFTRALAWVGLYSYSIYIWHVVAMLFLPRLPNRWFRFPIYFAIAVGFGVLMSRLIEVPALALRDRLFPSRPLSARRPPEPSAEASSLESTVVPFPEAAGQT